MAPSKRNVSQTIVLSLHAKLEQCHLLMSLRVNVASDKIQTYRKHPS